MLDLTPELKRDLILTLGSDRAERRFDPLKTAQTLDQALKGGGSFKEVADLVGFKGTSVLREIHRLLRLAPEIQHLVQWRARPPALSMTSASYVARLDDTSDQLAAIQAILEHDFSSTETRQLIETRFKSKLPIGECVKSMMRLRPHIDKKHLLVGAIISQDLSHSLEDMAQAERDELLRLAVLHGLGELSPWSGTLGSTRFTLIGGENFLDEVNASVSNFEEAINKSLEAEIHTL